MKTAVIFLFIYPVLKKWLVFLLKFSVFSALLLGVALGFAWQLYDPDKNVSADAGTPIYTVIIDAGHGGRDGGASADDDGTLEKHLNLAVAKKLRAILQTMHIRTVMTREEDIELAAPDSSHKKADDLANRVKIAEAQSDAIFVSIHMNKFPLEKYSGLQVYYSPNHKSSLTLAEQVQKDVCASFSQMPSRKITLAKDIYLMEHLQIPAILVECGFLSNYEEKELLKTEAYQTKIAMQIAASLIRFLSEYGNTL